MAVSLAVGMALLAAVMFTVAAVAQNAAIGVVDQPRKSRTM